MQIVDKTQWKNIQDHFSKVLGACLRTIDIKDNLIVPPSGASRICTEVITSSRLGIARCGRCLPPFLKKQEIQTFWKEGYQCHMGFFLFCIPVELFGPEEVIAYLLFGPVCLGKRPNYQSYIDKIKELGLELDKFIDALSEIKVYSFYGIRSVVELLHNVASYLAQLGYQKKELEKLTSLSKMEKFVGHFYVDKLLNALLDISTNVSGAEVGSVMLWDEQKNEFYIRVSRGLDENIAKTTRLKIGEGIAGLSAQEKRTLFVHNKTEDVRIRKRLCRPQLKAAIVTPLKSEDKILGIINVATYQKGMEKFFPSHSSLLEQLAKLVSVVLEDLYQ